MQLDLATIPAGPARIGSTTGSRDEQPVHDVWVDEFSLALHPVTNAEYRRFVDATGHRPAGMWADPRFGRARQPVVAISWFDAFAYCAWLRAVTGRPCRLPTEAEREKAATGGVDGISYPWGEDPAAIDDVGSRDAPHDVGLDPANGYGLHNMGDLVHEWCADWYDEDYYQRSPTHNPAGPTSGSRRSSRGGSWRHRIGVTRCAARSSLPPDRIYSDYGFRIAVPLAPLLDGELPHDAPPRIC